MTKTVALLLVAALVAAPAARAQQGGASTQPLVMTAANTTAAAEAARGTPRKDQTVRAGDVVRYTLTFTNTQAKPVQQVELKNPLPAGMHLLTGSASASRDDVKAEYSIDGGQTWSAHPTERVVVGGQTVERPVSADRYTNVRWTIAGWVAPRATVTAAYDARLRAPAPAAPSAR